MTTTTTAPALPGAGVVVPPGMPRGCSVHGLAAAAAVVVEIVPIQMRCLRQREHCRFQQHQQHQHQQRPQQQRAGSGRPRSGQCFARAQLTLPPAPPPGRRSCCQAVAHCSAQTATRALLPLLLLPCHCHCHCCSQKCCSWHHRPRLRHRLLSAHPRVAAMLKLWLLHARALPCHPMQYLQTTLHARCPAARRSGGG